MNVKKGIVAIAIVIIAGGISEINTDNKPVDVIEQNELVSRRTANTKRFNLGGVNREIKIYSVDVHYKEDGRFKTIDTAVKKRPLITAILSKYEYRTNSGIYDAFFDSKKPWNYRFEVGDKYIEFRALFEESLSCSISVETNLLGVKETITLFDDKAPTEFRWIVKSNGLQPNEPWAVDAKGNYLTVNHYSLGDTLVYEVDTTNAVYPIILDPSTTVQVANDGYVTSQNADYSTARDENNASGFSTAALTMGQRWDDPNKEIFRSFVSFTIPALSNVSSAFLSLNGTWDQSTDAEFDLYIHGAIAYGGTIETAAFPKFNGRRTGQAHNGTVLNETWNTTSYSDDWNTITFNAAGIDSVEAAQDGTLYIALISSRDFDNTDVGANVEFVIFDSSESSGIEPYISITYRTFLYMNGMPNTPASVNGMSGLPVSINGMEM